MNCSSLKPEIFNLIDDFEYSRSLQIFLRSKPDPPNEEDIQVYNILAGNTELYIPSKINENIYKYILLFIYSHIRNPSGVSMTIPTVNSRNTQVINMVKCLNETDYFYLLIDKAYSKKLEIIITDNPSELLIIDMLLTGNYTVPLFIDKIYNLLFNTSFNINNIDHDVHDNEIDHDVHDNEQNELNESTTQLFNKLQRKQPTMQEILNSIYSTDNNILIIPPVDNITNSSGVGEVNPDFEVTVKAVLEYILTKSNIIENTGPPYVFSYLKDFKLVYPNICLAKPYNLNICQVLDHIQNEYMGKGEGKNNLNININDDAQVPTYNSHSGIVDAFFNKILEKNTGHWNKLSRTLNRRGLNATERRNLKSRDVRYRLKYKRGRIPFWTKYGGKRVKKRQTKKKNNYK
jgi:hypothetical protein